MEQNKKIVIILSAVIVVLAVGFLGMTFYSMGLKKGQQIKGPSAIVPGPNESSVTGQINPTQGEGQQVNEMYVTEKEKQPEVMTGKIAQVEADKLVLNQFASIDLKYEVKKSDIGKIVFLTKNSKFNETKAKAVQEELMKLMPKQPTAPQVAPNGNSSVGTPQISEEAKKKIEEFKNNPELQMFTEVEGSWSQLKENQQVNIMKEKDETEKLTVYPDDFPIGPDANK